MIFPGVFQFTVISSVEYCLLSAIGDNQCLLFPWKLIESKMSISKGLPLSWHCTTHSTAAKINNFISSLDGRFLGSWTFDKSLEDLMMIFFDYQELCTLCSHRVGYYIAPRHDSRELIAMKIIVRKSVKNNKTSLFVIKCKSTINVSIDI